MALVQSSMDQSGSKMKVIKPHYSFHLSGWKPNVLTMSALKVPLIIFRIIPSKLWNCSSAKAQVSLTPKAHTLENLRQPVSSSTVLVRRPGTRDNGFVVAQKLLLVGCVLVMMSLISGCKLSGVIERNLENKYDKWGETEQVIHLDSASIHWRKVGEGKPALILIHGYGPLATLQWKKVVRRLRDHCILYIPDLVYFGSSKSAGSNYSPAFQARQIMKSAEELGIDQYYLAGVSYGGLVASLMASDHSENTKGLILIDALSKYFDKAYADSLARAHDAENTIDLLLPETGREMKTLMQVVNHKPQLYPACLLNEPARVLYADSAGHKGALLQYLYQHEASLKDNGFLYSGPTLIIWGQQDVLIPLVDGHQLMQHYAKSRLLVVPKSGHMPTIEQSKITSNAIMSFIDGVEKLENEEQYE